MPVYVYKCDACGQVFERKQAVTEGPLSDCPECEGRVRRVFQPVGIVFKGSGWYVTDHRSPSATTEPAAKETTASTPVSPAPDSTSKLAEAKPAEGK
jgi:putative FmdB family regulatory protein